jgi:hypothetical protein
MHSRPMPVTVAAILMVLISLVGLLGPLVPGSEEKCRQSSFTGVLCWALWVLLAPLDYGCSKSGACGSPSLFPCSTSCLQRQG